MPLQLPFKFRLWTSSHHFAYRLVHHLYLPCSLSLFLSVSAFFMMAELAVLNYAVLDVVVSSVRCILRCRISNTLSLRWYYIGPPQTRLHADFSENLNTQISKKVPILAKRTSDDNNKSSNNNNVSYRLHCLASFYFGYEYVRFLEPFLFFPLLSAYRLAWSSSTDR